MRPLLFLALTPTLPACAEVVEGNGIIESRSLAAGEFLELSVDDGIEATIDLTQEVLATNTTLTTDENLHQYVTSNVGKRLEVGVVRRTRLEPTQGVFLDIEAPSFDAVLANNGARAEVLGAAASFAVDVNNGAHFEGREFDVEQLELDANNGASASARCHDAQVNVNNGAEVTLCATGTVTGRVANGGDLVVECGGDARGVHTD